MRVASPATRRPFDGQFDTCAAYESRTVVDDAFEPATVTVIKEAQHRPAGLWTIATTRVERGSKSACTTPNRTGEASRQDPRAACTRSRNRRPRANVGERGHWTRRLVRRSAGSPRSGISCRSRATESKNSVGTSSNNSRASNANSFSRWRAMEGLNASWARIGVRSGSPVALP